MTSDPVRDKWDDRHLAADDAEAAPSALLVEFEDALPPGGHALDLACGRGRNAVWLARRGFDVDAVDFSTIGLAKAGSLAARSGVAQRVRRIERDLRTGLPPLQRLYDVVLLLHYRQPDLWPAVRGVVRRDGLMLLESLARHVSNLDVDPSYLAERDELLGAAGDFEVLLHGRAMNGKRAVERLVARRAR